MEREQRRLKCDRAVTLLEILIVVAIVAVLASVLFPVLISAKKRGKMTVAMSNLRQCYVALSLYNAENDNWKLLPNRDTAWDLLGPEITWDPADSWRKGREDSPYASMVGSFGYANAELCESMDGVKVSCIEHVFGDKFPLLVSIFYGKIPMAPDAYIEPNLSQPFNFMPPKALALWQDGHVKYSIVRGSRPESLFSWASVFQLLSYHEE